MKTGKPSWPQSNQRGIETAQINPNNLRLNLEPQSNQRGIETDQTLVGVGVGSGLNRTSVGLKLLAVIVIALAGLLPQSNQRGIETGPGTSHV